MHIPLESGNVRVFIPVHAIFRNTPFLPPTVPCIVCILPLNDEILPLDVEESKIYLNQNLNLKNNPFICIIIFILLFYFINIFLVFFTVDLTPKPVELWDNNKYIWDVGFALHADYVFCHENIYGYIPYNYKKSLKFNFSNDYEVYYVCSYLLNFFVNSKLTKIEKPFILISG
jgi:hypothetical protein